MKHLKHSQLGKWLGLLLLALPFVPAVAADPAGSQPDAAAAPQSSSEQTQPAAQAEFPRPEPVYTAKRKRDFGPFEAALKQLSTERIAQLDQMLLPASLPEIQQRLDTDQTRSEELVAYFIQRIHHLDIDNLNSVMTLNPDALADARRLDRERADGKRRGAMHGIPVLLKDNIAVTGMSTTAGAWAMRNWVPQRDAALVQRLRAAGAVILGKTNLSEWANFMDPGMPSGFSALGGQTRNPYGPFEVSGSSSGSAVAASAFFAPVTVGTETQGSLIQPALINGVVAIKTSKGLVSGDHIIPLVDWMDVPGPMARSVTDVAVLLNAMVDPATSTDFTHSLAADAAHGMRVGVIVLSEKRARKLAAGLTDNEEQMPKIVQFLLAHNRLSRLMATGFADTGVDVVEIDADELPLDAPVNTILPPGFHDSLNRFLQGLGKQAPVASLAGVITINDQDLPNRAPYGQGYLIATQQNKMSLDDYHELVKTSHDSAASTLAALFERHRIQALMSNSQAYAVAGFPAITIPIGYADSGQPMGVILVGNFMGEAALIAVGHALEQATQGRKEPDLMATKAQNRKLMEP